MPSFGRLATHPGTRSGRRVRNRRRRASSRGPLRLCFDVLQHLLALVTVADFEIAAAELPPLPHPRLDVLQHPLVPAPVADVEIDATKLLPFQTLLFNALKHPPAVVTAADVEIDPAKLLRLQPRLQPLRFNVVQRPPAVVTVADVKIGPAKLLRWVYFDFLELIISHSVFIQMASTKASTPSFQHLTTPPGGRYGCRRRNRQGRSRNVR
ncbi:hypothetical protein C8F04DRAFT_395702 [Mycena alexandri]|uniref:Uncharacterized protein n=1 Tax=Mycena alexandri TaxID=1745969 RepID=A0AAD6T1N5_9AGAR|nr:hypothetical protein C8F04DRAFT_395702 [Mycena alexandri]